MELVFPAVWMKMFWVFSADGARFTHDFLALLEFFATP